MHDHHGAKHGSRQAGVTLEQYLRAHLLIHKHEANKEQTSQTS